MRSNRTPRKLGKVGGLVLVPLLAATVAACGSGSGSEAESGSDSASDTASEERTALTLAVGTPGLAAANSPYSNFAGQTYWKEAGLDVTTEYVQGAIQASQLVAAGNADLSAVGLSAGLTIAAQDPNVKIIAITPGNVWQMAVPTDSPVKSLKDLKGETIGVKSLATAAYLYHRAALAQEGVDPDTDVQWLPIGTGAQEAQALESGQVAAIATYYGPYEVTDSLTKGGLRLLDTPLEELDGSGAWIVNADLLENNRDVVMEFIRGLSKTAIHAQVRPEDIIETMWETDPAIKPRDMSDAEAMDLTLMQVEKYWEFIFGEGKDGMYGVLSDEALEQVVQFHEENGIVEQKIDVEKIIDFSVTEEANDYDKAAFEETLQKES